MNNELIRAAVDMKIGEARRLIDDLVNSYINPYGASHMNRVEMTAMAAQLERAAKNAKRPEKAA